MSETDQERLTEVSAWGGGVFLASEHRVGDRVSGGDDGPEWVCQADPYTDAHYWEPVPALPVIDPPTPEGSSVASVPAEPYQSEHERNGLAYTANSPATDAGQVDFHELLKTDAQWALKERLHASLGRPYLAVQLAQLLPADVAVRLADRVDQLVGPEVERRVAARLEAIHYEVNEQTTATLSRLRADAEEKARALSDERFGQVSRLD